MGQDRDKQPRPAPQAPVPATAPARAAPLALGLGAPAGVVAQLARRPADERAAVLHDLHRGAGNRAVTRILHGDAPAEPGAA